MRALLYLKVACAGYPSAGGIDALLKLNISKTTRNAAVITHSLQRDTMDVDINGVQRLVVRPQPLASRGVIIRPFLVTAKKWVPTVISSKGLEVFLSGCKRSATTSLRRGAGNFKGSRTYAKSNRTPLSR